MSRPVELRYKDRVIEALVPTGDGTGDDRLVVRVASLRDAALAEPEAVKVAVVALADHCYMTLMHAERKEVMTMTREAVVVLLQGLATDEAKAFHAWLDAQLPAPAADPADAEEKRQLETVARFLRYWSGRTLH